MKLSDVLRTVDDLVLDADHAFETADGKPLSAEGQKPARRCLIAACRKAGMHFPVLHEALGTESLIQYLRNTPPEEVIRAVHATGL